MSSASGPPAAIRMSPQYGNMLRLASGLDVRVEVWLAQR
jgi:hypothetical protein